MNNTPRSPDAAPQTHADRDAELEGLRRDRELLTQQLHVAEQRISALQRISERRLRRIEAAVDALIADLNNSKGWWLMVAYRAGRLVVADFRSRALSHARRAGALTRSHRRLHRRDGAAAGRGDQDDVEGE